MSDPTSLLRDLLRALGLDDLPAIPVDAAALAETVVRLVGRDKQVEPARDGLSTTYTIDGHTAEGREFLFGKAPSTERRDAFAELHRLLDDDAARLERVLTKEALGTPSAGLVGVPTPGAPAPGAPAPGVSTPGAPAPEPSATDEQGSLTNLPLGDPTQWTIAWTTNPDVYATSQDRVSGWAASLTDVDAANAQFWPTIATHGLAYNLLILEKVDDDRIAALEAAFGGAWNSDWNALSAAGRLYAIDLSIFADVESVTRGGADRFTPATITLLAQDPQTKELTPVGVRVWGRRRDPVCFAPTDEAWLYALQAAKTSVTVYGIWLGHVYHWHIVSAAMQMTMFANLPPDHCVSRLLAPQSKYLVGFDDVLLVLWGRIAPPTAPATPLQFLELTNAFAKDRGFFADDPMATLRESGIAEADFSERALWDRYPIAGQLLTLWEATEHYVHAFVGNSYASDEEVANDAPLQAWLKASAADPGGNIRGLGVIHSKPALRRLLTSLVYRLTAHGASRLNAIANPALTFVANFPPCLQENQIPAPATKLDTTELLKYLPHTGTIGQMVNFYFTFAFSEPYEPLIPTFGLTADLFFPGGLDDPRNAALVTYRRAIASFIERLDASGLPQYHQWPMSIET